MQQSWKCHCESETETTRRFRDSDLISHHPAEDSFNKPLNAIIAVSMILDSEPGGAKRTGFRRKMTLRVEGGRKMDDWSHSIILASGARSLRFNSRIAPFLSFDFSIKVFIAITSHHISPHSNRWFATVFFLNLSHSTHLFTKRNSIQCVQSML
jgi:hypothetical protein